MENKHTPSKKKLLSVQEEKVNQPVDCDSDSSSGAAHTSNKRLLLELEIPQQKHSKHNSSQRVLVAVRPRTPAIKTIFLAEKSRFYPRKEIGKYRSTLAIGDHPSLTTHLSEVCSSFGSPSPGNIDQRSYTKYYNIDKLFDNQLLVDGPPQKPNVYQTKLEPTEKCYANTQAQTTLINHQKLNLTRKNSIKFPKTVPHYTVANSSDNRNPPASIFRLNKRINLLERKVRRQEMVLGAIDPCNSLSSSDEDSKENIMRARSGTARPGCSCNYSHIPETSAFQRYALQPEQIRSNKGTTIEKEHNSEQYGRDFTTYDGITARGRRQCASATCKRDDLPRQAAEKVIKIRHKLNPVRDYRLMDTVHYLAQGEFAPRNDGIKLTPSREAVLSDIIWEDVCRTHWPCARLARRHGQDRYNTRCELQRLIDNLLRERVAHVERRRRRHYRIIKLNHRHESSGGPLGKTGDIIVASHKHKRQDDEDDVGQNASGAMVTGKKWAEYSFHRHRSHEPLISPEMGKRHRLVQEECTPGPSYAVPRASSRREPTYCFQAAGPSTQPERPYNTPREKYKKKISSSSTASSDKQRPKNPRLVVKKDPSCKKYHQIEEPDLEHYILLPTLVVRTPSNVRRQKKFNELYHRILNQLGTGENGTKTDDAGHSQRNGNKKDSVASMDQLKQVHLVMESVKKWLTERRAKKDGIYVHHSPPKLLGVVSAAQLRQLARGGADGSLERAVLAGQGRRLLAESETLPLPTHLVSLVEKCEALHDAVEKGSLLELQELLESDYNRRKYVMCRDESGTGLLHKAVYYDYMDIAEWLVNNYPQLVHQRDSYGRTPLHYAVGRRAGAAAALLERAGAVRGARDAAGHTPAYYRTQRTSLALPERTPIAMPPDKPGLVIKRHNIRIWCHDCDMAKLQRVVWEGHGSRLLSEVSNQPVVKKFLEAVPYLMNTIRDIHEAVIQNDLEGLMKHAGEPVTPQALSSRDVNNLTVMHKAAGLGHGGIMKFIAERYPQGINDVDNDGRTPLHYAAIVRDEQHTYNTLVSLGADEAAVDNKNKTPGYYINRPQEIDKNILKTIPDAPRTPSSTYPSSWDWKLLDTEVIAELNKKSRRKTKTSSENISSKNNTTTISDSIENKAGAMKTSSTHEFIKDLPDLEDNAKINHGNGDASGNVTEDSQIVEETDEGTENHNGDGDKVDDEKADEEKADEDKAEDEENEAEKQDEEKAEEFESNHNNEVHDTGKNDDHNETIEQESNDERTGGHETESHDTADNHAEIKDQMPDVIEGHETLKDEEKPEIEEVTNDDFKNHEQHHEEADELEHAKNSETKYEEGKEALLEHEEINDIEGDSSDKNHAHHDSEQANNEKVVTGENIKDSDKEEETIDCPKEGNNNHEHNEDDDDVQVQGDVNSEYSDTNLRSTAELSDTNSAKRGNLTDGRSSQDSLIEGIVNGEAELDSQDASIVQRDGSVHGEELAVDSEIDPEVTELINNANMEMLAALVLNGEGARLVGRRSGNSELQAFLDNVSTYMQKINKVHLAAKDGNIRDLQSALDRRKFAIARDSISPNGATPLHVATVFGKTNIMKYLGGRFPETLSAVDFEGRTALHYAAVLPDNGHYYNLLQQLGANAKDLDDNGRSAEDYYKNPTLLSYNQLLSDFGINEETAKEILSDKVPQDQVSSRRMLDAPEELETLERCYRLLASARSARTPLSASSNRAIPPVVLGRFLKRPVFDALKYRVTKLDHDLFDVIWPAVKKLPDSRNVIQTVEEDFPGGVTAPDYYVYEVFHEFLTPLVKDLHNINVHADLPLHPPSDFSTHKRPQTKSTSSSEPLVEMNIDPTDEFVLSGTIECSRNLQGFELPINLKIGKLETIERVITTILMREDFVKICSQSNPESDQKGGTYYTLNEVLEKPSEISAALASAGLLIALCDREEIDDSTRLHGKHWPYGRGVYVSDDKTMAVWINVHDHIRVVAASPTESPGEIGLPFSKLFTIMAYLHEKLDFVVDYKLGHLSSRPTFLGSGIRFSLMVNFPGLSKDPDNMKHLCAMRGLQYRETLSTDIARISNYQCLSVTESNCFNDFTTAASNLLHLEKDLSMQNSAHIATMLSNIFRRKRSSLSGQETPDHYEKS